MHLRSTYHEFKGGCGYADRLNIFLGNKITVNIGLRGFLRTALYCKSQTYAGWCLE
jgi:hypothetical protein